MSTSTDPIQTVPQSAMAQLLEEAAPIKPIQRGEVIVGTVMHIDADGILVNIGHKSEGIVPTREMRSLSPEALTDLRTGDEILTYVLSPDSHTGASLLSLDKAAGERAWRSLQIHLDNNTSVYAVVKGFNRGGLVVEIDGLQGFIPISQLNNMGRYSQDDKQEDLLAQRVGESVELRLLEVNRRRNRLVLSEKVAMHGKREVEKDRLLTELQEGEIRRGRISSISSFGAFVDLGGADGLIHISEFSWGKIESPEDMVKLGDELDVYVLKVDQAGRKIGLSLRRLHPEPWETLADQYEAGQVIKGLVTKLTTFGAFARLEESIEGLIHISELSERNIQHPKEVVNVGDELMLKVINIEPERRRIALSLKRVEESLEQLTEHQE